MTSSGDEVGVRARRSAAARRPPSARRRRRSRARRGARRAARVGAIMTRGPLRAREDLDEVEVAHVRVGRRWTCWVSVPSCSMRVMTPIGSPGGYSESSRSVLATVPRVTTRSPAFEPRARAGRCSSSRSLGLPAPTGSTTPKTLRVAGARRDAGGRVARARVGQQRHLRGAAEDRRDAADERRLAHDRLADAHAVARALVDADRRVPDGRRGRDHPPDDGPYSSRPSAPRRLEQLGSCARSRTPRSPGARAPRAAGRARR